MFNETVEKIKNSENVAGTAHTSAVTNLDSFERAIAAVKEENVAGTAHTSAITNLDSYESAICEAKEEKE